MSDQSLIQNVLTQSQAATQSQAVQQPIDLFAGYKKNVAAEQHDEK